MKDIGWLDYEAYCRHHGYGDDPEVGVCPHCGEYGEACDECGEYRCLRCGTSDCMCGYREDS